jgi:hypothetical protein
LSRARQTSAARAGVHFVNLRQKKFRTQYTQS